MATINPHINFNGNFRDKYGIEWMVDFDPKAPSRLG